MKMDFKPKGIQGMDKVSHESVFNVDEPGEWSRITLRKIAQFAEKYYTVAVRSSLVQKSFPPIVNKSNTEKNF